MTYSSDGTARFWDSDENDVMPQLFKIIYVDPKGLEKAAHISTESKANSTGIRSLAIDPNQHILASGDRLGNIQYVHSHLKHSFTQGQ